MLDSRGCLIPREVLDAVQVTAEALRRRNSQPAVDALEFDYLEKARPRVVGLGAARVLPLPAQCHPSRGTTPCISLDADVGLDFGSRVPFPNIFPLVPGLMVD